MFALYKRFQNKQKENIKAKVSANNNVGVWMYNFLLALIVGEVFDFILLGLHHKIGQYFSCVRFRDAFVFYLIFSVVFTMLTFKKYSRLK